MSTTVYDENIYIDHAFLQKILTVKFITCLSGLLWCVAIYFGRKIRSVATIF